MFSIQRETIYLTLAGSHAHGTAREDSDVDLRGVCIAPLSDRLSLFSHFEQYEGPLFAELAVAAMGRLAAHPTAVRCLDVKAECAVFDIAKFIGLCAEANPNALEILFADERDWVIESPAWMRLHDERHRFLTRKVRHTFLGYAMAQLKRIKTHRSSLLNPPKHRPARQDFGLPASSGTFGQDDRNRIEKSIADKVRGYRIDDLEMPQAVRIAVHERMEEFFCDVLAATQDDVEDRQREVASRALSLPSDVTAALNAERRYRAAMKHWDSYQKWKSQRNPTRAETERRYGYDTKHAMHLIRLMRMGLEVLQTGELLVRRPDAAELNAIRDGALSFDDLLVDAARLADAMETAAPRPTLSDDVDRAFVDALLFGLVCDRFQ